MSKTDELNSPGEGRLARNTNRRTFYVVTVIVAIVLAAMVGLYGFSLNKDIQSANARKHDQVSAELTALNGQLRNLIIYTEVITRLQARAIAESGEEAREWGRKNFDSFLINVPEFFGFALVKSGKVIMRAGFQEGDISEETIAALGKQKGLFPARLVVQKELIAKQSGIRLMPLTERIVIDGDKLFAVVFLSSTKMEELIRGGTDEGVAVSALVDNAGRILISGRSKHRWDANRYQEELDAAFTAENQTFQSVVASKQRVAGKKLNFAAVAIAPFPINLIAIYPPSLRYSQQIGKLLIFAGGSIAGFFVFVFFLYRTSVKLDAYQGHLKALVAERTRELEQKSSLLEAVLGSINQGLVAYDEKLMLIISNDRFRELRDVPDDLAKPGSSFIDWVNFDAERGEFGANDPEIAADKVIQTAKAFVQHDFERTRPDGTILEIAGGPLPNGGFVSTFADITERKMAE